MHTLFVVARKEFIDGFRNRWLLFLTLVFLGLSLAVSLFGSAVQGQLTAAELEDTISSLATLAAFLIPLIAIQLSHDSFIGEQEAGTLLLLLSYPIGRGQLLLGKFVGQGAILATTVLLGFGTTALVLVGLQGNAEAVLTAFGRFIASSVMLGWIFIALGYLVSLQAASKGRAAATLFLFWFLLVLVYDLLLLGLLVSDWAAEAAPWARTLIGLNPVDLFRLVNLLGVGHDSVSGVLSLVTADALSQGAIWLALAAWLAALLGLSHWRFKAKAV